MLKNYVIEFVSCCLVFCDSSSHVEPTFLTEIISSSYSTQCSYASICSDSTSDNALKRAETELTIQLHLVATKVIVFQPNLGQ